MDHEEADRNALRKFMLGKAQREEWYEERELVGTFKPTQGLDGNPGFYYYNKERELAFHWDGDANQQVEVAHGGDHEMPSWKFLYTLYKPDWVIAGTKTAAMAFEYACMNWIDAKEDAR